jgi:predicted amidohydrolase YtcJ
MNSTGRPEFTRLFPFALILGLVLSVLAGCGGEDGSGADNAGAADILFSNARVYRVTDRQRWAEAVAVRGNRIVFVGSTAQAMGFVGDKTETIDLAGKMLLPGFVSGHDHLVASGWIFQGVELHAAKSRDEYDKLVSDYMEANRGTWRAEEVVPASLEANLAAASAAGITSFLNPGLITPNANNPELMFGDYQQALDILRDLDKRGALRLRAFVQPGYTSDDTDAAWFTAQAADFARRYDSDRLRSFGIKVHPGGNWTSSSALQLEPYLGGTGATGTTGISASRLRELLLAANAENLDVITHVEGSATARAAIDAAEASIRAGNMQARNALHHLSWVHPQDLVRIMGLHLTANVTPISSTDWAGQDLLANRLLGEERTRSQMATYPLLFNNGNRVSLSAGIPGSPLEMIGPLFSMQAAMTMQDPSNPDSRVFPPNRKGISLHQAIKGVTLFPAWQIRMEDKLGTIEVGKYADLVILEKNLFDVAPRDIASVKVMGTLMDGNFTWRDGLQGISE